MISNNSVTVSAPGKIILFAEHAVVQGKTAIASGLSLRTTVTIKESTSGKMVLDLPDLTEFGRKEWDLSEFQSIPHYSACQVDPLTPCEANLEFLDDLSRFSEVKGIQTFLFLIGYITGFKRSLEIKAHSQLPIGSGLGSSASFCVGICAALLKICGLSKCKEGCTECTASTPCKQQLTLINDWSLQGEKIMHGTPSGIDNAVATFGKAITFTRKSGFSPLKSIPKMRILIVNSGVSRSAKTLVEKVVQRHIKFPSLLNPVSNLIETISNECLAAFDSHQSGQLSAEEFQEKMELLIDMNHSLLDGCYGVGHPTIDRICQITKQYNLHTKITGAGGGGCVITLLKSDFSEDKILSIKSHLEKEGFESWEATIGDSGVSFH